MRSHWFQTRLAHRYVSLLQSRFTREATYEMLNVLQTVEAELELVGSTKVSSAVGGRHSLSDRLLDIRIGLTRLLSRAVVQPVQ